MSAPSIERRDDHRGCSDPGDGGPLAAEATLDCRLGAEAFNLIDGDVNIRDTRNVVAVERDFPSGGVAAETITLDLGRFEFTPTAYGASQYGLQAAACNFTPPARYTSSVTR